MTRTFALAAAFACFFATSAHVQTSGQRSGRSADDWCRDSSGDDRESACEVRETAIAAFNPLEVDAGRNGGVRVHGWDRSDARLRARVVGYGDTQADARRVMSAIRIETAGGRIRAEGPDSTGSEHWSVSFELDVPSTAMLTLRTHNGGIAIENFHGSADFHAQNGGVSLVHVGGDIHGATTNGGITVELTGDRWDGAGLDVETRNGGVRLSIPSNYSAELETGTTNGTVRFDFPVTVQGSVGRHYTATLGAGGAKVRAITTNGGVTVRQSR